MVERITELLQGVQILDVILRLIGGICDSSV